MKRLKHMSRVVTLAFGIPLVMLSAPAQALNILLTNDDGYDSHNIRALYVALKSAGHQVAISAPKEDQSGKSSSITFLAPAEVGREGEGSDIYYVGGTPVMALLHGVDVLSDTAPDLVVSGPNEGHNLGTVTNTSGTVGAAVMALKRGIPAIAVSADRNEQSSPPAAIADVVVKLVSQLEENSKGERLLPKGVALNVNLPPLQKGQGASLVKGIKYTSVSDYSGYNPMFVAKMEPYLSDIPAKFFANERDPSGEATKSYVGTQAGIAFGSPDQLRQVEKETESEGLWLEKGYITISPMKGNYGSDQGAVIESVLDGFSLN